MIYFCDSFERWTSASDCYGKWDLLKNTTTTTDHFRSGLRSMYIAYDVYQRACKGIPFDYLTSTGGVCAAFGYKMVQHPNNTLYRNVICEFTNYQVLGGYAGNNRFFTNFRLIITDDRELAVEMDTTSGSFATVSTAIMPLSVFLADDVWYHLGFELTSNTTTDILPNDQIAIYPEIVTYVNEKPITINLSGTTWLTSDDDNLTYKLYPRALFIGNSMNSFKNVVNLTYCYYDDLYIADQFHGDLEIDVIDPVANYSNNWTPSAGTNWSAVAKDVQAETPYVAKDYDSTPAEELNEMSDVNDIDEVVAIQGCIVGYKTHGSTGIINHQYNTNPTTKDSYLGKGPLVHTDVQMVNPDTAVAWTPSEIDDLKFGQIDAY